MTFSWLAKILVHQPVFVLLAIAVLSISCTIIPFLMRPLPDFSDPQKGFETRGTILANKIMAWRNLMEASKSSGPLVSNTKVYEDQRRYENEQLKPRKKKDGMDTQQNPNKATTKNITRWNSNSVEQDATITTGIMKNSTSDSRNRTESIQLLFEELQNKNKDFKLKHFRGPNPETYFCSPPDDGYVKLLIASTRTDLFTATGLYEVCRITSQLESVSPYEAICEVRPYQRKGPSSALYPPWADSYDSHSPGRCCRPWSLPNYIALLRGRPSCLGLTEEDVMKTKRQLLQCAPYFFDKRLGPTCGDHRGRRCKVPAHCTKHNAVYTILTYLISTDYALSNLNKTMHSDNDQLMLHETLIFLPIQIRANTLELYKYIESQILHLRQSDISIVALNFGDERKHDVFNECLIKDSRLMILGGICVIFFMWIYTNSTFITIMTIIAILFSLSLAFFIYTFCYEMKFFPFMNLLTFIVAIGVGSDDSFIFNKIWATVKTENKNATFMTIMTKALDMSLTSMAVTSVTTAAAFMVSGLSAITAIRCFGIFAGTSVIVNYIVMALWIPACFVIHERYNAWFDKKNNRAVPTPSSTSSAGQQENANMISVVSKLRHRTRRPVSLNQNIPRPITRMAVSDPITLNRPISLISDTFSAIPNPTNPALPPSCMGFVRSVASSVRYFCGLYRQRFFIGPMEKIRSWILYIVTGPPLSSLPPASTTVTHHCIALAVFTALTIIAMLSAVVVFHYPRLRLPESNEFQLFSDSHPFEQYDMVYKDKFFFRQQIQDNIGSYKMPLRFVWGVLPMDDGNHLDPESKGKLHYDPDFDVTTMESQSFLLEFCTTLKRQPFFQISSGPLLSNCFMSTFHSWMEGRRCTNSLTNQSREPCCEKTFPYDPAVFNICIVEAMNDMYDTPEEFLLSGVAGPKFSKENFPAISAIIIEYESNISFSFSYTEINTFVTEVEQFFNSQLELAPHTMKRGWFITDLAFYDLQHSLSEDTIMSIYISMTVALIILFGATLNVLTSLYAIFTILCSILVTLAILVLSGWRLNILESVAVSSAIGLAIDFSLHYTVRYNHYSKNAIVESRRAATRQALGQMIGPTSMAALTTSIAGLFMLPSSILAYIRIGVFLVTIMSISWIYATFHLGIMLAVAGPERNFGQFRYGQVCENVRRQQRRRRRRRQGCARSLQLQLGDARSSEVDVDDGNIADDEGIGRIDSHELETLAQSTDLNTIGVNVRKIFSGGEEEVKKIIVEHPLIMAAFEPIAGPSGTQCIREFLAEDYELIEGSSGLQGRRTSSNASILAQAHTHARLSRAMSSNGSSRGSAGISADSVRFINEQSPSTESAITIIMPDQDEI